MNVREGKGLTLPCAAKVIIRPKRITLRRPNNRLRILIHNREPLLHLPQPRIGHLVRLLRVRLHVAESILGVGLDGFAEGLVGAVGDVEGLLADGVLGEGGEGVADDGVAGDVGDEFAGGRVAVGGGLGHVVGGCVRHGLMGVLSVRWT